MKRPKRRGVVVVYEDSFVRVTRDRVDGDMRWTLATFEQEPAVVMDILAWRHFTSALYADIAALARGDDT